ncbi:MAG: dihydrodipicolinate synthase family protein [Planctomycetaceae bacterium]|nr:dihydrodipicolinate synthase family protein [Planctomycetaceae bacterium]
MPQEMLQPIRGIVPPLATPLTAAGEVDVPALARLVDHVIAGGVHGLFALGTTGEGPSLAAAEQRLVLSTVAAQADGRVPVLAGVSAASLGESLALAAHAADCGCDAIVATPPFYFAVSQAAIADYYRQLARTAPLPTVLYNMPAVAKLTIEPETISQLIDEPGIVALKDSSGDLNYFAAALRAVSRRVDFPVLVGPEHLLARTLAMGGAGGVCGGANIFPTVFASLYDAHLCDDAPRVAAAHQLVELIQKVYAAGGPLSVPSVIAQCKAALEARGLCRRTTKPPIAAATDAQAAQVAQIVQHVQQQLQPQQSLAAHPADGPS